MKFAFVAFILFAAVDGLLAAQCYSCAYVSGLSGDECNDPFDTTGNSTDTCEGTYCMKSTAKINGEVTSVTRSCSEVCTELCAELFGIEGCAFCCQGDNCNGASSLTFSICTIVSMVTFVRKLSA
ncbi:uncharacterized protein LOC117302164 [Asterias rubens]|uniref:uncharacterized protein LOC117302164 n=1 Tax=Asterias rubens TaxID=7604 RepID=UPI0014550A16|nr:uncharacterized protein LOC117302164 [Asterias rubens]